MSSSALDDYEVEAASPDLEAGGAGSGHDGGGPSEVTPLIGGVNGAGYGDAGPGKEVKKKKGKSGQKLVADALKTDMAAERTFFKWLWTGLHTGAIGTFIFVTFDDDKGDPYRLWVVGFAWFVAFALVLFGLYCYNRRRAALRSGALDDLPIYTRDYGPYIVVAAIVLVVGSGFLYALFSGANPRKSHKGDAFKGVL